jgi:phospholipid/cholesterol/gamma-HCH transport system substrate-binding protein
MTTAQKTPVRRLGRLGAVAVALVVAVGSAACTLPFQSPATLTATARFSDVGDLASGAPVELADIPVGHITAITLHGQRAQVSMVINRSAAIPSAVSAQLRRTTLLGEQYIDLVPARSGAGQPLLQSGAVITRTSVVPGIEQLVSAGASVFGAVNSTDLADLVATGAQGFGGQGQNLRQLLDSFATVAHGYAGQTATIQSLVTTANQLTASLAPNAGQDAQAVTTLSQTTGMLATQSGRLVNLLQSLNDLSVQGRSLIETYLPQINQDLTGLAATTGALQASESDLGKFLDGLPGHNAATKAATVNSELQVLDDIIVCGIPGGGANASIASQSCGTAG